MNPVLLRYHVKKMQIYLHKGRHRKTA